MKTEDLRERLAEAIYGEGDAPEWLTTTDGSPNTASFEYAQRLIDALARAGFDIAPRTDEHTAQQHKAGAACPSGLGDLHRQLRDGKNAMATRIWIKAVLFNCHYGARCKWGQGQ